MIPFRGKNTHHYRYIYLGQESQHFYPGTLQYLFKDLGNRKPKDQEYLFNSCTQTPFCKWRVYCSIALILSEAGLVLKGHIQSTHTPEGIDSSFKKLPFFLSIFSFQSALPGVHLGIYDVKGFSLRYHPEASIQDGLITPVFILSFKIHLQEHTFFPWRRKWQSTPVFLPGKCHGQRSLAGYSPWGCKELDTD